MDGDTLHTTTSVTSTTRKIEFKKLTSVLAGSDGRDAYLRRMIP